MCARTMRGKKTFLIFSHDIMCKCCLNDVTTNRGHKWDRTQQDFVDSDKTFKDSKVRNV